MTLTPTVKLPLDEPVDRVVALRVGSLDTTKGALFHRFESYGEPDHPQRLDYYFFLIQSGNQAILVDTGFDRESAEHRGRQVHLSASEALSHVGLSPADIDLIVITHFHYDHIGNVRDFPGAELLLPRREVDFYRDPLSLRHHFSAHVERAHLATLEEAIDRGRARLIDGRESVAPGVAALTVGGHSPGQQVVEVRTRTGLLVLASDAVHLREELGLDRPFAVLTDLIGMYRTFESLRARQEEGWTVIPGHDPCVSTEFPVVSPGAPAFEIA